jgi:hypothetical protein
MGGEPLRRARIEPLGVEGDRVVHVEDAHGTVITSRSHPRFLGHKGTLGTDGEPLVDGQPWNSPVVAAKVVDIVGPGARLVRFDGAERFDVLPLLVATDGAIAAFGHDGRRLRPNIVIGGVDGLAEREWAGGCLRIGKVLIGVQDLRQRCRYAGPEQGDHPQHLPALRRNPRAQLLRDRAWRDRRGRRRAADSRSSQRRTIVTPRLCVIRSLVGGAGTARPFGPLPPGRQASLELASTRRRGRADSRRSRRGRPPPPGPRTPPAQGG